MNIVVDQSGVIGKTSIDTVFAFSNGADYAILIPRKVKKQGLEYLREKGVKPKAVYLKLFTTDIFLLIKDFIDTIDKGKVQYLNL